MYILFVTVVISGVIHESELKAFDRFEECWEAASILVHNRPDMTARCVAEEFIRKQSDSKDQKK